MKAIHDQPAAAESARWERAAQPLLDARPDVLWRAHCDSVNAALFARWLPPRPCARLLKTDLWDEAMGGGLYPLLATRADRVTGLDVAPSVVAAARARYPSLLATIADVRQVPFATGAFDVVVSNSTLDHFDTRAEIVVALRELLRVLARGGQLLLTLDNLVNPVIAMRSVLPHTQLRRLGLLAYPVGATCGPRSLARIVREVGFEVQDVVASLHCPRVLAVRRARRLQRRGSPEAQARFAAGLLRWERLADLPTRFLTGHFVGVHARKP